MNSENKDPFRDNTSFYLDQNYQQFSDGVTSLASKVKALEDTLAQKESEIALESQKAYDSGFKEGSKQNQKYVIQLKKSLEKSIAITKREKQNTADAKAQYYDLQCEHNKLLIITENNRKERDDINESHNKIIEQYKTTIDTLSKQAHMNEDKNKEFQNIIQQQQSQIQELSQTINETQKETIDGLKTDNKQLQDLISSLNDKMSQKDEILKVKLDYISKLEEKIETYDEKMNELRVEYNGCKENVDRLNNLLERDKQTINDLQRVNNQLELRNKTLKVQLSSYTTSSTINLNQSKVNANLSEIINRNQDLSDENTQLKIQVNSLTNQCKYYEKKLELRSLSMSQMSLSPPPSPEHLYTDRELMTQNKSLQQIVALKSEENDMLKNQIERLKNSNSANNSYIDGNNYVNNNNLSSMTYPQPPISPYRENNNNNNINNNYSTTDSSLTSSFSNDIDDNNNNNLQPSEQQQQQQTLNGNRASMTKRNVMSVMNTPLPNSTNGNGYNNNNEDENKSFSSVLNDVDNLCNEVDMLDTL